MKTTQKQQNALNRYLNKEELNKIEFIREIKQGEKQLEEKERVLQNYWDRFVYSCDSLTEDQYYSLDGVTDLCYSYEEMSEENEYNKENKLRAYAL